MGNKLTPRKRRKKRDKNYPKMNETISGRSQNGIFLHFTAGQSRSVCAGRRKIDVVVENSKIEYMNVKKNCGLCLELSNGKTLGNSNECRLGNDSFLGRLVQKLMQITTRSQD
ncbi:hypothetical protein RUM44_009438 [Polyplax serrata]|uniref:Uncharacterized protein n=1 Tax=Polyplax serrata TaxID=468196 RepID=A0ABR1ATA2_POLSC